MLPDVLKEREFRLLFLAQSISAFGDRFYLLALPFAVLKVGGSAGDVGLVLAGGAAALVVFMLIAGVWADRLPRQRLMLASDLARFGIQMISGLLLISDAADVSHLFVLAALFGASEAFFIPAQQGLVPQVVSSARLQDANALLGFTRNATGIAGPAVGGILVALAGPGAAILVDGFTFLISAFFLTLMRPARLEPSQPAGFLTDLREGWSEFVARSWLWVTVAFFAAWHLVVLAPQLVIGPVIAEESLGGAGAWATIMTASGVGAILGSLLALRWRPARPLVAFYLLGIPIAAESALIGAAAPVWLICTAAVANGVAISCGGAFWFTTMQEQIPARSLSRVSSYDWAGSLLFLPVGLALAGPVAELLGNATTLYVSAVWNILAALSILLLVPSLRRVERGSHEPTPAEVAAAADTTPVL